jgi:beta-galactosidase
LVNAAARHQLFLLCLALAACRAEAAPSNDTPPRRVLNFDADWRFLKGDAAGAEQPLFDDSDWRRLNLPHDWSIEGPFAQTNQTGGAGGFLPAGTGWYRKQFTLPSSDAACRVFVRFEGVMANSDVWINGQHLGHRPYGYVSFEYELTPGLNFGTNANLIAVRVDDSKQPASRWYAGAGIYRHVRLLLTGPVHFETWSTFITTPRVDPERALVHIHTTVTNESGSPRQVQLEVSLLDSRGNRIGGAETRPETVKADSFAEFSRDITVDHPDLWTLDRPVLYQVLARVRAGEDVLDQENTPFGIRRFEFGPETGFWLNGKHLKIKGVCLHHDGGAFGAAVPARAWERRLAALKQLGVNAIRTAHNPPAPGFLDLCDRMGFLVMDEFFDCWTAGKNPYDYHIDFNQWSSIDVRDTIRRDRNHPSVILYSVGNEIRDTTRPDLAKAILRGLVEICHENDSTRPVTQALFRPNATGDYTNGLADLLDVIGTNYRDNELLAAHRARPSRRILGTEQRHDRLTWLACRDHPEHAGQFLWTGVDYLGESRRWPVIGAGSGLLDRTGTPRPIAYQRQSWWSDPPMVFITRRVAPAPQSPTDPGFEPLDRAQVLFPDWSPRDRKAHEEDVEIYSNCREVELLLNNRSLGAQPLPADASPRTWSVRFKPGTLRAVGRNQNHVVATCELRTAGTPAKIVLAADRTRLAPVWDDVACVTAEVVDEHGVLVPDADPLITFTLAGPGSIVAVDNADNSSHEPFAASRRHAFQGRCVARVKAAGAKGGITVTASAPDLQSGSLTLETMSPPEAR